MVDNQKSRDELIKGIESLPLERNIGAEVAGRDAKKQSAIEGNAKKIASSHNSKGDSVGIF